MAFPRGYTTKMMIEVCEDLRESCLFWNMHVVNLCTGSCEQVQSSCVFRCLSTGTFLGSLDPIETHF